MANERKRKRTIVYYDDDGAVEALGVAYWIESETTGEPVVSELDWLRDAAVDVPPGLLTALGNLTTQIESWMHDRLGDVPQPPTG
jgi:hypothetical protein